MSKTGYMVCTGALCLCKFGTSPGKLKVLKQTKHYINDAAGSQKLIATEKEIGQPFESPFFGSCSKMNNSSCAVNITEWSGFYDKVKLSNGGHPLMDSSKATCPTGAKDCITINFHGQTATPSAPQVQQSDNNTTAAINPAVNMKKLEAAKPKSV
jgi:hypothetical protein